MDVKSRCVYACMRLKQQAEDVNRLQKNIKPYLLRRMKEDVEKAVPPKEETIIEVKSRGTHTEAFLIFFQVVVRPESFSLTSTPRQLFPRDLPIDFYLARRDCSLAQEKTPLYLIVQVYCTHVSSPSLRFCCLEVHPHAL